MSEIAICAYDGEWYEKCRKYIDSRNADIEKVDKFAADHGISKADFAFNVLGTFFVKDTPSNEKFRKSSCKKTDGCYLVIKGNSKLGKEFSNLNRTLENMRKPDIFLGLIYARRMRCVAFFYKKVLYISASSDTDELKCPDGFKQMKLSEYYKMVEDINSGKYGGVEKV